MKKILLQLDSDRTASVFDAVTAYDAGADVPLEAPLHPQEARSVRHFVRQNVSGRGGNAANTVEYRGISLCS